MKQSIHIILIVQPWFWSISKYHLFSNTGPHDTPFEDGTFKLMVSWLIYNAPTLETLRYYLNFHSDVKFLSFCFNIDGIFRRLPKQATNRQIFIKNVSSKYLRRWRNMSRYFTKQVIICLESLGYCKWLFPW